MNRYLAKRLLVSALITAVLVAGLAIAMLVRGEAAAILQNWPTGLWTFALVVMVVEFSGKMRGPVETYWEKLDDDWVD